jgi:hypothetical protein
MATRKALVNDPRIIDPLDRPPPDGMSPIVRVGAYLPYPVSDLSRGEFRVLPFDPVLAAQQMGLGKDFEPVAAADVRLEDVFDVPPGSQFIDFSIRLAVDKDLPNAFDPHEVGGRTLPANQIVDELGVFERCRITQVACGTAIQNLEGDGAVDVDAVIEQANADEKQLNDDLKKVRTEAKRLLDCDIDAIETKIRQERQAGTPSWKIQQEAGYRKLHDLYRERDRLEALLSSAVDKPPADNANEHHA